MTQKLTNPDGSYFLVDDKEKVGVKDKGDDKTKGWYQDPNGWWKNPDPDRAWDPKPPG